MSRPIEATISTRSKRSLHTESLLDQGRALLIEGGFHLLTIERVAARLGHSRTTLYKAVASRRELLGRVALRTAQRLESLLQRVEEVQGSSRERMWAFAIGYEVFARIFPDDFALHQLLGTAGIRHSLLPDDLEKLQTLRIRSIQRLEREIERGMATGDLRLNPELKGSVLSSLYALSNGFLQQVGPGHESLRLFGVADSWAAFHRSIAVHMDGEHWQPLSSEMDYPALRWRILVERFPEHLRALGENSVPES